MGTRWGASKKDAVGVDKKDDVRCHWLLPKDTVRNSSTGIFQTLICVFWVVVRLRKAVVGWS